MKIKGFLNLLAVVLCLVCFCSCSQALATGDIAIPVVPEPSVIPEAWVKVINAFAYAVGSGFMVLFGWAVKKNLNKLDKDATRTEAIDAVDHGVESAELSIARKINEQSADGKYTKEEIEQLQKHAIEQAMIVAKGPALDLLKSWGTDYIKTVIARIVEAKKKKASLNPPV